jgi:hypothetical protein
MSTRPLRFSLHALDVLQEREINMDWVQRVVDEPALTLVDLTDPDLVHALAPIPGRDGRVLRVVYNRNVEPNRVVTAFFDRATRGKL